MRYFAIPALTAVLLTLTGLLVSCEEGMVTEVSGVSRQQCARLAGNRSYYYAEIQQKCSYRD